MLDKLHYLV